MFTKINELQEIDFDKLIAIKGSIESIKLLKTKNEHKLGIFTLSDLFSACDVVLFPSIFDEYEDIFKLNNEVEVHGYVHGEQHAPMVIAEEIVLLN